MPPVNPWMLIVGLMAGAVAFGKVYGSIDQRVLGTERDCKALKTDAADAKVAISELEKGQVEVLSKLEGLEKLLIEIRNQRK